MSNSIRYNGGVFFDDPQDRPYPGQHQNPLPDYMHIDRTPEQVPQLFGILSFCGEQGPAGYSVMKVAKNEDVILSGDGTPITNIAYTVKSEPGEDTI